MLSRLQCTFCLNQNNVNDYIKPCTRQSKLYAWNYVVPWHHTCSGYATAHRSSTFPSYKIILIVGLSTIKNKNLMISAFYTTRDTLQWR